MQSAARSAPSAGLLARLRALRAIPVPASELANIDSLRFVASFAIVLCHSCEFLVPRAMRPHNHLQTAGLSIFVDVFFVLSGFIISFVYAEKMDSRASYGRFLQKRLARLYPLYLAAFVAMTAISLAIAGAGLHTNTAASLSAQCLGGGALLLHAWFDCGGMPPLGVSWSISAELLAYLLFPIGLLSLSWGRMARGAGFLILLALCALPFDGIANLSETFSALRALPPFYFGMIVWAERAALARIGWPRGTWLIGSLAIGVLSFLEQPRIVLLALAYLTSLSAIGRDLATGSDGAAEAERRRLRLPAQLGQLTYSLYMLHPIVILVLLNGLADKYLQLGWPGMIAATLFTWGLMIPLGYISLAYFENPARRWVNALRPGSAG